MYLVGPAVRLPKHVVEALAFNEGDHVELTPAGPGTLAATRDFSRNEALERMRGWDMPKGVAFDREEAHAR